MTTPRISGLFTLAPTRSRKNSSVSMHRWWKTACAVFRFCAAMAIDSPAKITVTTLVNFDGANGNQPMAPLVQGTDGNFYGTTMFWSSNAFIATAQQ